MQLNPLLETKDRRSPRRFVVRGIAVLVTLALLACAQRVSAQQKIGAASEGASSRPDDRGDLEQRVETLEAEVAELRRMLKENARISATSANASVATGSASAASVSRHHHQS